MLTLSAMSKWWSVQFNVARKPALLATTILVGGHNVDVSIVIRRENLVINKVDKEGD